MLAPDNLVALLNHMSAAARPITSPQTASTICTPRRPACGLCPWRDPCVARAQGTQETFPRIIDVSVDAEEQRPRLRAAQRQPVVHRANRGRGHHHGDARTVPLAHRAHDRAVGMF